MAHPAEVQNDLKAQLGLMRVRGYNQDAMERSLIRAIACLGELMEMNRGQAQVIEAMEAEQLALRETIAELDRAAETAAQRYEDYVYGKDQHGNS